MSERRLKRVAQILGFPFECIKKAKKWLWDDERESIRGKKRLGAVCPKCFVPNLAEQIKDGKCGFCGANLSWW